MPVAETRAETWKVAAPCALVWEHWDDESVLFDRRSGQTHLLTAMGVDCLLLLQEQAMGLDQLSTRLAALFEVEPDGQLRAQVSQLLETFAQIGLVSPSSE